MTSRFLKLETILSGIQTPSCQTRFEPSVRALAHSATNPPPHPPSQRIHYVKIEINKSYPIINTSIFFCIHAISIKHVQFKINSFIPRWQIFMYIHLVNILHTRNNYCTHLSFEMMYISKVQNRNNTSVL